MVIDIIIVFYIVSNNVVDNQYPAYFLFINDRYQLIVFLEWMAVQFYYHMPLPTWSHDHSSHKSHFEVV